MRSFYSKNDFLEKKVTLYNLRKIFFNKLFSEDNNYNNRIG